MSINSDMNSNKDIKKLMEFQEVIYHIIHSHSAEVISENDIDKSTILNIQAAVLLKTAIELYTLHFKDDEDIIKILDIAKKSLSNVRFRTEIDEPKVLH
tara:strand:- start:1333 stop:1629 length:297 start_codon:yes stop_codon:yes gene_type:complete